MPVKYEEAAAQQQRALEIMNVLHKEGFANLWLDSVTMYSGGPMATRGSSRTEIQHQLLKIVVDREALSSDEVRMLIQIAEEYGARIILDSIRMNQQEFSRVCIWPRSDD